MAKFHGKVGYASLVETSEGVYEEVITEKTYFGDIIRNSRNLQSANQVNDNVSISFEVSIISDPFGNENYQSIRYVEYQGTKWKVTNVNILYPRLVMTVGGIYNGQ